MGDAATKVGGESAGASDDAATLPSPPSLPSSAKVVPPLERIRVETQRVAPWRRRPLLPRASPHMGDRRCVALACGGDVTLALSSGISLGREIGDALLRMHSMSDQPFADVTLIVEGRHMTAHCFVLAQRSPKFRALIIKHERPNRRLEILLPELDWSVAQQLLHFIYTAELATALDAASEPSLTRRLRSVAEEYGLPRLAALCTLALQGVASDEAYADGELSDEVEEGSADGVEAPITVVPAPCIAANFAAGVADETWADALLVPAAATTLDEMVPVHRCMLSARSRYFAAMFQSAPDTNAGMLLANLDDLAQVIVPDSPAVIVAVMQYMYGGVEALPPLPTSLALDVMRAAVRYELAGLRLHCESALALDEASLSRALQVRSAPALRRPLPRARAPVPSAAAHPRFARTRLFVRTLFCRWAARAASCRFSASFRWRTLSTTSTCSAARLKHPRHCSRACKALQRCAEAFRRALRSAARRARPSRQRTRRKRRRSASCDSRACASSSSGPPLRHLL